MVTVKECKEHMANLGYSFSHYAFGSYVFINPSRTTMREVMFTLSELRDAVRKGF